LSEALVAARLSLFPTGPAQYERAGRPWGWGIRPVEQAVSVAVRIIAYARMLTTLTAEAPLASPADR